MRNVSVAVHVGSALTANASGHFSGSSLRGTQVGSGQATNVIDHTWAAPLPLTLSAFVCVGCGDGKLGMGPVLGRSRDWVLDPW